MTKKVQPKTNDNWVQKICKNIFLTFERDTIKLTSVSVENAKKQKQEPF
jgi:hypothetical protein